MSTLPPQTNSGGAAQGPAHEPEGTNVRRVWLATLGFFIALVGIHFAVWWTLGYYRAAHPSVAYPPQRVEGSSATRPWIEPSKDLAAYLAVENQRLNGEAGKAESGERTGQPIAIGRAMELLAKNGWPSSEYPPDRGSAEPAASGFDAGIAPAGPSGLLWEDAATGSQPTPTNEDEAGTPAEERGRRP